ncbi:MAG: hypothetical protein KDA94_04880 [Acidimicrobiales bacterium]|nr:hypothetical protein [Acidimicrobiales bacterium]
MGPKRVDLALIERLLCELPEVADAAVVPAAADGGAPVAVGIVSLHPGATLTGPELRWHQSMRVPLAMVPRRIEVVPRLPRTEDGSLDRDAMDDLAVGAGAVQAVGAIAGPVADLWRRQLGTTVSLDEEFDRIGGDFGLAQRTSGQIEDLTGRWYPPSVLVSHPTPRALEELVGTATGAGEASTAVLLADGRGPTVAIAYDMDGSAFTMRDLATSLGGRRVIGLDLPTAGGRARARSFEELVGIGADDLIAAHDGSPLVVIGYSLGAIGAFELAVQLRRRGQEVAMVGLIDLGPVHVAFNTGRRGMRPAETWPWRPPATDPFHRRAAGYLRHAADQPRGRRLEYVARAANVGRDFDLLRAEHDLRVHGAVRPSLRRSWSWYRLVEWTVDHRLGTWDGDAVLFVCDQTVKGNVPTSAKVDFASKLEATIGWGPHIAGHLTTWPVVGVHTDLVEPPYVKGLGEEVSRAIEVHAGG